MVHHGDFIFCKGSRKHLENWELPDGIMPYFAQCLDPFELAQRASCGMAADRRSIWPSCLPCFPFCSFRPFLLSQLSRVVWWQKKTAAHISSPELLLCCTFACTQQKKRMEDQDRVMAAVRAMRVGYADTVVVKPPPPKTCW